MTHHDLRTWPNYFEAVWSGQKTFEVRYDDRGYQRGDTVTLHEFDRDGTCSCERGQVHDLATCGKFTGRRVTATIGHVLSSMPAKGNQRGFTGQGYVVFSPCQPVNEDVSEPRPKPSSNPFLRMHEAVAR